ncbi:MAG TPA: hypothetical protein PKV72_06900 [Candidatus Peribacteria bacterium]|nr:hypothetical protein [Candidatus Peribacteria bacterium]
MNSSNTLRARIDGDSIVVYNEGSPETPVAAHNVAAVQTRFRGDTAALLSVFEYSARIGLPLAHTGSSVEFGQMMEDNLMYSEHRTELNEDD